jgi:hypothetical protein
VFSFFSVFHPSLRGGGGKTTMENDNKMKQPFDVQEGISDIKAQLRNFTGTENYYKHYTGIKFTDGIKFLAEKLNCFWFLDIIASYQHKLKNIPFQIWKIMVNKDKTAMVTMKEDTGQPNIISQELKYTDFPLDEYEVYCIDGVILLKSEY